MLRQLRNKIFSCLIAALSNWASVIPALAEDGPEDSVVYIQVGYIKDGVFRKVADGSGFVINGSGWVVTAKHVLDEDVPTPFIKSFRGSITSSANQQFELFTVPGAVVSSDIGLLRFPPALPLSWKHLKIVSNKVNALKDQVEVYGFPADMDMTFKPGLVTSLSGPNGSIQINAGLAPGMSGGPVLIANTRCVIGVVAGGGGYPTFDYFTPIQYAKSLLDEASAEYISIANPGTTSEPLAPLVKDYAYRIDLTKDDHGASKSSRTYSSTFNAHSGAKIIGAKYVEESAAAFDDRILTISPDRQTALFSVKLTSGPFYDQTRGWWHGQVVVTEQQEVPTASAESPNCGG